MALDINLLKQMSPGHAINALRAEFDPLINTELELFLIDWIERLVDEQVEQAPVVEAAGDGDFTAEAITELANARIRNTEITVALLKVLKDREIESVEMLETLLITADQFASIAEDAGDVFTRLNNLSTLNQ